VCVPVRRRVQGLGALKEWYNLDDDIGESTPNPPPPPPAGAAPTTVLLSPKRLDGWMDGPSLTASYPAYLPACLPTCPTPTLSFARRARSLPLFSNYLIVPWLVRWLVGWLRHHRAGLVGRATEFVVLAWTYIQKSVSSSVSAANQNTIAPFSASIQAWSTIHSTTTSSKSDRRSLILLPRCLLLRPSIQAGLGLYSQFVMHLLNTTHFHGKQNLQCLQQLIMERSAPVQSMLSLPHPPTHQSTVAIRFSITPPPGRGRGGGGGGGGGGAATAARRSEA